MNVLCENILSRTLCEQFRMYSNAEDSNNQVGKKLLYFLHAQATNFQNTLIQDLIERGPKPLLFG